MASAFLVTAVAIAVAPVAAANPSNPRTISRAAKRSGRARRNDPLLRADGFDRAPAHLPEETVRRLCFIRSAQKMGFSLKEIGELTGLATKNVSCEEMCSRMDEKLTEIGQRIEQLTALRNELARLVGQSPRAGHYSNCKVAEGLGLV
jgi:hypothetical protein